MLTSDLLENTKLIVTFSKLVTVAAYPRLCNRVHHERKCGIPF
jgi:hypothetical protein